MPIVILVALWMSLGTSFLVFIAGLQGIDNSLYEAGAVDGIRNRVQELWFINTPSYEAISDVWSHHINYYVLHSGGIYH